MIDKSIVETASHKTVIVLDRGPKFAEDSLCDLPIQLRDESSPNFEHMGTVKKSLWNCSIESVLEFHRILTDLFPSGTKQLRFVISDFVGRALTKSWAETKELIRYDELIDALSAIDVPNPKSDVTICSVLTGIALSLEAICEQSMLQKEIIKLIQENRSIKQQKKTKKTVVEDPKNFEEEIAYWRSKQRVNPKSLSKNIRLHEEGEVTEKGKVDALQNKGNIVLLTALNKLDDFNYIVADLVEKVKSQNQMVESLVDANLLPIDDLYVYVVNISPNTNPSNYGSGNPPKVIVENLDIPTQKVTAILYNCQAGDELNSVIWKILMEIYDLVSTTVSGIPMKEESNPSQSISYDVELLHLRKSHFLLKESGLLKNESQIITKQEHNNFETVRLKWLSPSQRLKSEIFPLLLESVPATPSCVNSREAVCLTSFIVNNNKNVMLRIENPPTNFEPNLCGNLITHFITHEEATGVMLIQTVAFGPMATLHDNLKQQEREGIKPNLNYAIFNQFMKTMSVTPEIIELTDSESEPSINENLEQAKRVTAYFPSSLKDTFIFNVPEKFEPILSLIPKSDLTADEFEKCKKWMYTFVGSKNGSEPFTLKPLECVLLPRTSTREEQFRVASDEIYKFMKNYVKNSTKHLDLLNMFAKLMNFKELTPNEMESISTSTITESAHDRDQRSSSPCAKRPKKIDPKKLWTKNETINLYDYFNDLYEKEHSANWRDFVGRENAGDKKAELYPHLNLSQTNDSRVNRSGGAQA